MSTTPTQAQLEAEYKQFTDAIERHIPKCRFEIDGNTCATCLQDLSDCWSVAPISPPAQKPASVPGGSGAGLVGTLQLFDAFALVYAEVIRLQDHIAALPVKTCQDHADLTDLVTTSQVLLEMANIVSSELPPAPAPEPCLFPQPLHESEPWRFGTGRTGVLPDLHLCPGFDSEFPIDAPDCLPAGAVRATRGRGFTYANCVVSRPGTF